jgi:hypothetical protein
MKKFLFVAGTAFAVTLAIVVGVRMSPDALAVIIGVVSGVLASVPTTAILVWVLRQREKQIEAQLTGSRYPGHYPPVVVVNGQGSQGYERATLPPAFSAGTLPPGARHFKIIGQEKTETVSDTLPPFWEE